MTMEEIIRKLHKDSLLEKGRKDKMSQKTQEEISSLLRDKKEQLDERDYEDYQEDIFLAASAAEENGFVDGFKYAFRLFTECIR